MMQNWFVSAVYDPMGSTSLTARDRVLPLLLSLAVDQGGVTVIAAGGVRLSVVPVDVHPITFEFVCVRVVVNRHVCTVVTVYRPGTESVQSALELADLIDAVATRVEPVYLLGDLNIQLDSADDANAVRLVDLLGGYGLNIKVSVPTHQLGELLDVAATRRDLPAPDVKVVDVGLSTPIQSGKLSDGHTAYRGIKSATRSGQTLLQLISPHRVSRSAVRTRPDTSERRHHCR